MPSGIGPAIHAAGTASVRLPPDAVGVARAAPHAVVVDRRAIHAESGCRDTGDALEVLRRANDPRTFDRGGVESDVVIALGVDRGSVSSRTRLTAEHPVTVQPVGLAIDTADSVAAGLARPAEDPGGVRHRVRRLEGEGSAEDGAC